MQLTYRLNEGEMVPHACVEELLASQLHQFRGRLHIRGSGMKIECYIYGLKTARRQFAEISN